LLFLCFQHGDHDHGSTPGVRSCENTTLAMIDELEDMMMHHGGHARLLHGDHDHGDDGHDHDHDVEDLPDVLNCTDMSFTLDFGDEVATFHIDAFEIDECPTTGSKNCYQLACNDQDRLVLNHYIDTCCASVTDLSLPHHSCDIAAEIFALENSSSPSAGNTLTASTLTIAACAIVSLVFK